MSPTTVTRYPVGAELRSDGKTGFRVWAPEPREVALVIERGGRQCDIALEREPEGYYSTLVKDAGPGTRYWYRLDGDLCPDPASRFQPDGPFGPSAVVDAGLFQWSAVSPHIGPAGHVIYELHVGTFTREGTWRSAIERLDHLAGLGVTVIEVMPVAEFPGRFGWGYDGVFPYAPTRLYGSPDDFRAFIDAAHARGLGVILDVVYNHLGPDGCVFAKYSTSYFAKHANEWGDGLNFDGPCSASVREYFSANAADWVEEFRLDGLRLDATQSIHDRSREHIIRLVVAKARSAAGQRPILLVAENEPQSIDLIRSPEDGGYGLDMMWNDDFHHSAIVALTGRREAYYTDYRGVPQEFISVAKHGFLFQGQRYEWQKQPRGTRTDGAPPTAFVNFVDNHDQVANSGDGSRVHTRTAPGRFRAMTALLLLMPGTPMLFQGQEFGASSPFLYFADHRPDLANAVQKGRLEFVSQFRSLASAGMQQRMALPHDPGTFERCKLDWRELDAHAAHRRLHEDLLALRKSDRAFTVERREDIDGAVLAPEAFVLRFTAERRGDERLLLVNFGADLRDGSFAEPLVAPPRGHTWIVRWSSEDPDYGGVGTPDIRIGESPIPGHSAIVLAPSTELRHDGDESDRG
jgi:maltooligosyltrehalose trehalohydrolase